MYWSIYTPGEWEKHKADLAAGLARRKDVARRTIDTVDVSSDESERLHNTPEPGGRKASLRSAAGGMRARADL